MIENLYLYVIIAEIKYLHLIKVYFNGLINSDFLDKQPTYL